MVIQIKLVVVVVALPCKHVVPVRITSCSIRCIRGFIGKVDFKGLDFYLLGDINYDMLPGPTDHNTNHLNVMYIYGLNQLIKELTRVTGSTSQLK